MIFTCDNCGFIFNCTEETHQCPDCGKYTVRSANEAEQEKYSIHVSEIPENTDEVECQFPDFIETCIERIDCFKFKLPATALQINSKMLIEVVVEHGINKHNKNVITANVWARPVGGTLSGFLSTVHIQVTQDEDRSELEELIVAAINDDDQCQEQLYNFITMLINHESE